MGSAGLKMVDRAVVLDARLVALSDSGRAGSDWVRMWRRRALNWKVFVLNTADGSLVGSLKVESSGLEIRTAQAS